MRLAASTFGNPPAGRSPNTPPICSFASLENPGAITLCPVSPILNVGIALAKAPDIARLFKEIVIMGSTIFHPGIHGNPSAMADANFWNDPEAAQIVLRSAARIKLVGMDVTMNTLLTAPAREDIAHNSGRVGAVMMEIADIYVKSYQTMYRASPAAACTIRWR
jgi:purine nucleosidase